MRGVALPPTTRALRALRALPRKLSLALRESQMLRRPFLPRVFSAASHHTSRMTNRERRQAEPPRRHRALRIESLENRRLLATLEVDIADPNADLPGDQLFSQIHEAVDAASPGDLIKVHSGTYQPVAIYKNQLTVTRADASSAPVIDAAGASTGVSVFAGDVTLSGLKIVNASFAGIYLTGSGHKLTDNVATANSTGILLYAATGNALNRNLADGNLYVGISLQRASSHNTLKGNSASANGRDGLFVIDNSDKNVFTGLLQNGN